MKKKNSQNNVNVLCYRSEREQMNEWSKILVELLLRVNRTRHTTTKHLNGWFSFFFFFCFCFNKKWMGQYKHVYHKLKTHPHPSNISQETYGIVHKHIISVVLTYHSQRKISRSRKILIVEETKRFQILNLYIYSYISFAFVSIMLILMA